MDRADIAILEALQADSRMSVADVGEKAGLSSSACHRRMQVLEKNGVILGFGAHLDPSKLGLGLHAFIEITLRDQCRASMDRFEDAVVTLEDIMECYLMSGTADYRLTVAAKNIEDFDDIHRNCLSRLPGVSSMTTKFLIRRIKDWTGYPVRRISN